MKPIKNRIIIKYDSEQKEYIVYGSLKLYSPNRTGHNENLRVAAPTCAEVVSSSDSKLKKGDLLLFPHTILDTPSAIIKKEGGYTYMTLPLDQNKVTIYGKLCKGGEIQPLFGNVIVKRIEQKDASSIIITPDAYKKNEDYKAIVLAAPLDSDIHEGDAIVYYKYSDYELVYNINGEEKSVIMVKREDIVGKIV